MKRLVAAIVILGMASPAFADIRSSAAREATLAAQQGTSSARAASRNLWPGYVLLGSGAVLAIYGFTHTNGIEGSVGSAGQYSVKTTHPTGVGIAGLGVAGLGAYLLKKNWNNASPDIEVGPRGVSVRKRVTF